MNYLKNKDSELASVAASLNSLLADYHVYYQKLRNFHWNIHGRNFFELHEKFEDLYTDARSKIDEIAERVLTLGYRPMSNLSNYLKVASIEESKSELSDTEMVRDLLGAHQILIHRMYEATDKAERVGDEGTIDLIGAYIRELEKTSWMLSAWNRADSEFLKEPVSS
jgi:starvation-inducible DNA-binding protein